MARATEEVQAIVDTAHAQGKKVAIRSYGASRVKGAARAGDYIQRHLDAAHRAFKAGDIVGVDGDPLERIDAQSTGVRWVMKDGAAVVDPQPRR